MSEIKIEQIDDDGFLLGDNEPTQAENALLREIKGDTSTIINLMKGTQRLQREALKATQAIIKPKGNQSSNVRPSVNLVHPNRQSSGNQTQRVNLNHPNRPTANNSTAQQANNTARPRIQQNQQHATGSAQPPERTSTLNRQRDANGRFVGADNQASDSTQGYGNRDSRGRFVGGNGQGAAERAASSRLTDSLKDLNNNLTINANTDRIDPMIDAMKEVGDIASVGIDAGKKALSLSNTLIAKPAMALGRGIKGLFKPKTDAINSPVAWYKRIWRTLERGNRQDQTQHLQEQRRLDELVKGQGQRGSADSGLLAMLGFGLAALLAAFKNFKWPEFPKFEWPWGDGDKNHDGAPVVKAPSPKIGTPSTRVNLNHPNRPPIVPTTEPTKFHKAMTWLKDTKAVKFIQKAMTPLAVGTEVYAGGKNALDIDGDKNLTEEQKSFEQKKNATRTVARIGGSLGGAAAGAKAAALLAAPTANPFIIGSAAISGGILGSIYGAEGAEKANDWFYGKKIEQSSTKAKIFVEPSAYADSDSDARKLYDEHKSLDVDGSGIITRDELIKGGRSDLLGEPEAVKTKGFTPEKAKSIQATAERLGVNPNHLAQIISFETGGSFDPAQKNLKGGSARGLIQFMPDTAKSLGTTTEALAAMTFDEQILYVEKYLKGKGIGKNGKTSLPDMYDAVLGSGYKKGSKEYAANQGVDADKNGVITKGEAVKSKIFQQHAKQYIAVVPKPTAKTSTAPIPTAKATSVPTPSINASQVPVVKAEQQPMRLNTQQQTVKVSIAKPLVSQNMSDRGIAHIVTGGIGELSV